MFPPIPAWDALHPLLIHFPIALLLVAPLLVIASQLRRSTETGFAIAALTLMVLGTIGAWLAVATGEAAGELAERLPGVEQALQRHEELAEMTRTLFTTLCVIFGLIVMMPRMLHKPLPRFAKLGLTGAFLLLYLGSSVVLVNTAHQGGRLVHELGVHAMLTDGSPQAGSEAGTPVHQESHDND